MDIIDLHLSWGIIEKPNALGLSLGYGVLEDIEFIEETC